MAKEDVMFISNLAVSIFTTILLVFVVYILFRETPKEMRVYRWMLVNVQLTAYVEIIYYSLLAAPIIEPFPMLHTYCVGLLSTAFHVEPDILLAIDVYLHTLIAASMMVALGYRYRLLCVFDDHWFYRLVVKHGPRIVLFDGYFTQPIVATIFVYVVHQNDTSARATILKLDPKHVFPSSVTAYGQYRNFWMVFLIGIAFGASVVCAFVVYDSNRILKKKANSNRTAVLHKNAINAIIIQMILMEGVSLTAACFLAVGMIVYPDLSTKKHQSGINDALLIANGTCYSLKSIACSLAIILVHKPYRIAVSKIIGKHRPEPIHVSSGTISRI